MDCRESDAGVGNALECVKDGFKTRDLRFGRRCVGKQIGRVVFFKAQARDVGTANVIGKGGRIPSFCRARRMLAAKESSAAASPRRMTPGKRRWVNSPAKTPVCRHDNEKTRSMFISALFFLPRRTLRPEERP
ncbi:MAG: hypothetical protein FWF96_02210 [Kiritimatiellaeota bacterium]|nr:hypothetical protein [Kiritimatiellota bacterium]